MSIDSMSHAGRFDLAHHGSDPLGMMRGLAGAFLMRPDQGKCRNFVIYRRLFARRERPMPARARCGPVCMPRASSADSIIGRNPRFGFGVPRCDSKREERVERDLNRLLRCPLGFSRCRGRYPKISNRNSRLERNFNHEPVLFVQHPLEKGRTKAGRSGSLVACAELLGNCDRATEGGIPRSSR